MYFYYLMIKQMEIKHMQEEDILILVLKIQKELSKISIRHITLTVNLI